MCKNFVCICVCTVFHQDLSSGEALLFTCFSICCSTWMFLRLFPASSTGDSEVQQCHPVDDLKDLKALSDKWSQHNKFLENISYCMSPCNQLKHFPLVVSQTNCYFSIKKINNLNISLLNYYIILHYYYIINIIILLNQWKIISSKLMSRVLVSFILLLGSVILIISVWF